MTFDHEAFISYSHAADGKLAPELQRRLERFDRYPWQRSRPIFRDQTTLALTPHLWPVIKENIDKSRTFVLLASQRAAQSEWVNDEVKYWLSTRGPDRLLIVLTEGTIRWNQKAGDFDWDATDCLPPALAKALPNEPLWENVSALKTAGDLSPNNPVLAKAVASLYSAITGRSLQAVIGDDVRRRKNTRVAAATLAAFILAGAGGTFYNYFEQQRTKREAAEERVRTERQRGFVNLARTWQAADHPEAASATLVEGLTIDPADETGEMHWALLNALHASHEEVILPTIDEQKYAVASDDGRWIAAAGGQTITLINAADRTVKASLDAGVVLLGLRFSRDGTTLMASVKHTDKGLVARRWVLSGGAKPEPPDLLVGTTASSLRLDPDGGRVATLNDAGVACIAAFDAAHAPCAITLQSDRPISDIQWLPGGVTLAGIHKDGSLALWNAAAGTLNARVALDIPTPNYPWRLAADEKGRRVVAWVENNENKRGPEKTAGALFELEGPRLIKRIGIENDNWIGGATFSPDGKRLALRTRERARLLDAETGTTHAYLIGHTSYIRGLVFSPDSTIAATASYDRSVRLWDAHTGALRQVLNGHTDQVHQLAFSRDGCRLVSVGDDKTARIWRLAAGVWHQRLSETPCDGKPHPAAGGWINTVKFGRDGAWVVTGSTDRKARVWNARAETLQKILPRADNVLAADFDPTGNLLALGHGDLNDPKRPSLLSVHDWLSEQELASVMLPGRARTVEFSADGQHLVAAIGNGMAAVFRFNAGALTPVTTLPHGAAPVTSAAWNADGRRIVTTATDGRLCVWTLDSFSGAAPESKCRKLKDRVYDAAWSHSGHALAAVDGDATIHVWPDGDIEKDSSPLKLLDDRWGAEVAFTSDDKHVVVRLHDGSLLVRNIALKRDVYTLKQPILTTAFALSRDGRQLATAQKDGAVQILPLDTSLGALVQTAREGLIRCLTPLQRERYGMPTAVGTIPEWCRSKWPSDTSARTFRVHGGVDRWSHAP
ncbi:MAG: TIR domain-containing protein [Hyphomicrobiaceae bacterium]